MIGFWGTIALVVLALFVVAWFYDRRHQGEGDFGGRVTARRRRLHSGHSTDGAEGTGDREHGRR